MENTPDVRPSPIAGQWYSADAHRLSAQIDHYLDEAELPELEGEVVGVMAPHAGHLYSGAVAGYAFAAIRGRSPELVAVVSPMHYPYFEPVLTTAHSAYATPLGAIPVDVEAMEELDEFLQGETGVRIGRVANDSEHSLEIELPFLQRALPKPFRLVPLMLRDQGERLCQGIGKALAQTLSKRDCLLVASTDLSHFYSQTTANRLDGVMLQQVEAFDPAGVIRTEEEGKGVACGRGALAAVMWAARGLGASRARVLQHATSGDVTGDYDRVVGYGAAAFLR
jgi:MEMO1 family protein